MEHIAQEIQLSPGEWKLMEQLWAESPQTITRLTAALQAPAGWSKHTIITMLNRLEAKGAVRHDEGGPAKQFYPLVPRAEAALQETESLLQKVYGGSLGLLVNAFVAQKGITEEERAELMQILESAGETAKTAAGGNGGETAKTAGETGSETGKKGAE